jgi:hypothetical protein
MKRWIAALLGSAALITCGVVHGFWTDRWAPPAETAQAAERLETIPLELDDWDGEVIPVKPGEAGAGVAGWIRRRYVNRQSGAIVSLLLVCGRSGPVSIHTPEACYAANGFLINNKDRYEIGVGETMWKTDAIRTSASEETRLRLYWGWNDGTGWAASVEPRVQFVRRPVLHKLYVVREVNGANESIRSEPCEEFLRVLLPALRRTLFTPL